MKSQQYSINAVVSSGIKEEFKDTHECVCVCYLNGKFDLYTL